MPGLCPLDVSGPPTTTPMIKSCFQTPPWGGSPCLRTAVLHQPAVRQAALWVHPYCAGTVPCSLLVGDRLCAIGSLERRLAGWRWTPVPASAAHSVQFTLFLRSGLPFSITCPDFSKCTSLHVGLYAVKIRAEAMQEASEAVPSGMLSVLGQRQSKFTVACLEAQEHCRTRGIENPVCEVSNYLFPDCRVISGHLEVGVGGSSLPRARSGAEGGITAYPAARRA